MSEKWGDVLEKRNIYVFKVCLRVDSRFRFLFFTPDAQQKVEQYAKESEIPADKLTTGFLIRSEVPYYLSASDFGLVPVHQYPSKRVCSPIKNGEYWACELPIIIPKGLLDDYVFAQENSIGFILENLEESSVNEAAQKMIHLWSSNDAYTKVRKKCRAFVERDRNVAVYKSVYKEVFLRH